MKRASEASAKSLSDDVTYKVDEVVAFSLLHDLCILKLPDAKGVPLHASINNPTVGEEVIVAGNPEGLEASISKGIVSAIREERGLIQIDAPISPGSSGGPVVNQSGEVIGVAVSTLVEGQNLNFAVRIGFVTDGMLFGHSQTVWAMGRLSVSNLENDGFHGRVKSFEETHSEYSRNAVSNIYIEGPAELTAARKFGPEGRLEEIDYYSDGVANGKMIWEYSNEGVIKAVTEIDGKGNSDGGKTYPIDTALMTYEVNNPLDETRDYFDKGSPEYQLQKYDLMGREVEFALPNKGIRYESRFDAQGKETERLEYKNGKLYSAERFTYVMNAQGDWAKAHGTLWLAEFPSFGYTPWENFYRKITYHDE
jgi:hypothetical protein